MIDLLTPCWRFQLPSQPHRIDKITLPLVHAPVLCKYKFNNLQNLCFIFLFRWPILAIPISSTPALTSTNITIHNINTLQKKQSQVDEGDETVTRLRWINKGHFTKRSLLHTGKETFASHSSDWVSVNAIDVQSWTWIWTIIQNPKHRTRRSSLVPFMWKVLYWYCSLSQDFLLMSLFSSYTSGRNTSDPLRTSECNLQFRKFF